MSLTYIKKNKNNIRGIIINWIKLSWRRRRRRRRKLELRLMQKWIKLITSKGGKCLNIKNRGITLCYSFKTKTKLLYTVKKLHIK